ncbi:uncharacterized protein LOC119724056 [Patiria miniata]|uniref:F5/8 type C domain-containing protein n=1 Tax=Patiria miniata TaxID=46514 RepID=A0A913ZGJ4_PATMI|nr:uncharacterized protein LOC119724056 [Patiria miniata]
MMSPLGVACLPLLMLSAISYNGALSQPLARNNGAMQDDFSQYADRWTLRRSGCTCQFDFTRRDCACCIVGGAQCPIGAHNLCVKCGQEYTCGIPHPVIKDRVVNGWTGAMECPCPGNPSKEACACCINGGCPCANDPYRCTECGTTAGCGDGKNNPAGPPYVLNKDFERSREGYGIHVHRDPALPNPVPLGVGSGRIPDGQMSASSYIDDHMGPHRARLNALPSDAGAGGWSPLELNRDQYLQIDLVNPTIITGVATQGRAGNSDEWVTSYNLAHSSDGSNWNYYGGDREGKRNGRGMMFKGNSDCDEIVHHNLEDPINARYVRFLPQDYYNRIGMRVELYGQEPEVPTSSGGGIQNLALYKPAEQSSTFEPIFGASGAVDGKDDEGIVITKVQTQPWWYVDLQDHYQIYFVAINNPGIMLCAEPKILTNFVVRVGDNPDVNNNPPCTAIYRRKVEPGESVQIQCQSIDGIPPVGRYVSIELNPDNPNELTHLQVSEVKVYGVATPVPGPTCRIKEGAHYLGMESGEINGAQIDASNYLKGYQPQNARLNLPNRAWVAECRPHTPSLAKEKQYYLKIDLLALTDMEGLLTQGSLVPEESYVSQFMMETSVDGEVFVPYKAADGTVKLFQSNMDGVDIVCHLLPSQICVRAIKIIPISWHRCVAMRVELLGYRVQHVEPVEVLPATQPLVEDEPADEGVDMGTVQPATPIEQEPTVKEAAPAVTTAESEPEMELPEVQTTVLVPVLGSKLATLKPVQADVGVSVGKPSAAVPIPTLAPKAAPVETTLKMEAETEIEMPEVQTTVLIPVVDTKPATPEPVEADVGVTAGKPSADVPIPTLAPKAAPVETTVKIEAETEMEMPEVQTTVLVPVVDTKPATPEPVEADVGVTAGKPSADVPIPTLAPKAAPVETTVKNEAETEMEMPEVQTTVLVPVVDTKPATPEPVEADVGVTAGKPSADVPIPTLAPKAAPVETTVKIEAETEMEMPEVQTTVLVPVVDTKPATPEPVEADVGVTAGKPSADVPIPTLAPKAAPVETTVKIEAETEMEMPEVQTTVLVPVVDTKPATPEPVEADVGVTAGKPSADVPIPTLAPKAAPVETTVKIEAETEMPADQTTAELAEVVASTTPVGNIDDIGKPAADETQNTPPEIGKDLPKNKGKDRPKNKGKDRPTNKGKDRPKNKGKDRPKKKGKKGSDEEEPSVDIGEPAADEQQNKPPKRGKDKGKDRPKKKGKKGSDEEEPSVDIGEPAADEQQNKPPNSGKDKGKDRPKNKGKDRPKNKGKDRPKNKGKDRPKKKGKEGSDEEEPSADISEPAADEQQNKPPKRGKDKGKDRPKNKGKDRSKKKGKKGSDEEEPSVDIGEPAADEQQNKPPKRGKDKGKDRPKNKGKGKPQKKGKKGSDEEEPSADIGEPAADEQQNKPPKRGKDKGKDKRKKKGKKGSDEEEPSADEGKPAADEQQNKPPKRGKDKGKKKPKKKGKKGSDEEEPSADIGEPAADEQQNKPPKRGKDKGKDRPKKKGKKGSDEEEPSVDIGEPAADEQQNKPPKGGKDKGKDRPKKKGKKGSDEEEPSVDMGEPAADEQKTKPPKRGKDKGKDRPKKKGKKGSDEEEPSADIGEPAADEQQNKPPKRGKDKGKDKPKKKGKKGSDEEEPSADIGEPAADEQQNKPPKRGKDKGKDKPKKKGKKGSDEEEPSADIGEPAADEQQNKPPKRGKDKGKDKPKKKGKKGKEGSDEEEPSADIGEPAADEQQNKSPKRGKDKGKDKPKKKGKKGSDEEEPSADIGEPAADEQQNKPPKRGKDKGKDKPKKKGKKGKKGSDEEEPSADIGEPAADEQQNKPPKRGKDKGKDEPKKKGKKGKKGSDEEEPSADIGEPAADEQQNKPPKRGKDKGKDKPKKKGKKGSDEEEPSADIGEPAADEQQNKPPKRGKDKGKDKPKKKGKKGKKGSDEEEPSADIGEPAADEQQNKPPKRGKDKGKDKPKKKGKKGSDEEEPLADIGEPAADEQQNKPPKRGKDKGKDKPKKKGKKGSDEEEPSADIGEPAADEQQNKPPKRGKDKGKDKPKKKGKKGSDEEEPSADIGEPAADEQQNKPPKRGKDKGKDKPKKKGKKGSDEEEPSADIGARIRARINLRRKERRDLMKRNLQQT